MYALILAGGSGERFWPLSRRALPKQLLRLVADRSLLEETVSRLDGLIPPSQILVLTNIEQEKGVRDALKNVPGYNVIAEPAKRDTSIQRQCIALFRTMRRGTRPRRPEGNRDFVPGFVIPHRIQRGMRNAGVSVLQGFESRNLLSERGQRCARAPVEVLLYERA